MIFPIRVCFDSYLLSAHNLSYNCAFSQLKHSFCSPLKGLSNDVFRSVIAAVPIILKDALQVTSQSIEGEMGKTLKMVYQLTGKS